MSFKVLIESPVGAKGRTTVKDALDHITPELEKDFAYIVKLLGGKAVARVLLDKVSLEMTQDDNIMKKYRDINSNCFNKMFNHKGVQIAEDIVDEAEAILIKNNIKIKNTFKTKFGTEFFLAKKYPEKELRQLLRDFTITIVDNSVFVSSLD